MLARMWRKGNPCALLWECKLVQLPWKTLRSFLKKIKNRTTTQSSKTVSGYTSNNNENTDLRRYLHTHIHCSITYNIQDINKKVPISGWMHQENTMCIYNGVLLCHKTRMKFCHLWQHGLTLRALCQVKQTRQRQIPYDLTSMWD